MGAASSQEPPPPAPAPSRPALGPRPSNPYLPPTQHHHSRQPQRPIEYRPPVQQSSIVRNTITISKSSISFLPSPLNPNSLLLTFQFNADVPGAISVYYHAKEIILRNGNTKHSPVVKLSYLTRNDEPPSNATLVSSSTAITGPPVKTKFKPGQRQTYTQKADRGLDTHQCSPSDFRYKQGQDRYPLVIRLEAYYPPDWPTPSHMRVTNHVTFAELIPVEDSQVPWAVNVIAQQVLVGGTVHRVMDLYGIGATTVTAKEREGEGWQLDGHECVICLTENCNTAVLPCNHFCLCEDCARVLCSETDYNRRKCPVCRGPLEGLMRIIPGESRRGESEGSGSLEGGPEGGSGGTSRQGMRGRTEGGEDAGEGASGIGGGVAKSDSQIDIRIGASAAGAVHSGEQATEGNTLSVHTSRVA